MLLTLWLMILSLRTSSNFDFTEKNIAADGAVFFFRFMGPTEAGKSNVHKNLL